MSKGSNRRPTVVEIETFSENWQRIFGSRGTGNTPRVQATTSQHRNIGAEGEEFVADETEFSKTTTGE